MHFEATGNFFVEAVQSIQMCFYGVIYIWTRKAQSTGTDAIKKFTPSLGIPSLGV